MSIEPVHISEDKPAQDILRRSALWQALVGLHEAARLRLVALREHAPKPDTSIDWEDGEVEDIDVRVRLD